MIVSQSTSRLTPSPQGYAPSPASPPADLHAMLDAIAQGLQLSRASTMTLMRLQLAVRGGDRLQAMEAIDRFDTLDAELEGIVTRLHSPGDSDANWQALSKHIEAQRLALAFEKLALASGIVGPGLVSIEHAWSTPEEPAPPAEPTPWAASDELPDLPDLSALRPPAEPFEPPARRGMSPQLLGLAATLLLIAAIAGAVLLLH